MSRDSLTALLALEVILEKSADITAQIQHGLALESLLQWVITDARALLQCDRVLIYRFLEDQDAVVAFESVGADGTPLLGQRLYDPCLGATWVERYQQGHTTTIADVHNGRIDPCYVQLLARLQVQANLVVPIFSQSTLWGLLIAHHCRSPHEWQPLEVQFLQHIALPLGVAVQQATLRQRQQHLESQIEQQTADSATDCSSHQQCLVSVSCDRPGTTLRSSEAQYYNLVNHLNTGLVVHAPDTQILQCNDTACALLGLSREQMLGKVAIDPGWQFLREDASVMPVEEYPVNRVLAMHAPLKNYVVGIRRGDQSQKWGLVTAFPEFAADGSLLQVVVTFIDISRLKQAELDLQWQSEQRRLLLTVTQQMRQTLDLDHILQTAVSEVRQFLQTDRVIIYQFEPNWSGSIIAEAVAVGWTSILGKQITDTYFLETEGKPYIQGRVKASNDIYTDELDPCHVALLEQMQVRANLVVPILQDNHLWGLLVAQQCNAPRLWATLEIELLQHLATQLAIAIQQAELYRQVQTCNTRLELQVQERTAQLQKALEFEALLKRITDRVRDSLDERHILQTSVEALAQGLSIGACDAGIYNAEQTTSTIAYEVTNTLASAQGCTFELATATHPEVYPYLLSGRSCQFSDVTPHPLRADQQRQTTLAVPLIDDQGVLGDLWLFKPSGEVFDDQDVRLVQQVANQCAIALRQSRLYQAAQAQVQALERLNQLKDDFLSTVSHELRTPMSNIKMATQMLEISLEPLGVLDDAANAINHYFKILREEGKRELTLINDLLDLARLDADTEPLTLTTINLQIYLPHLADSFSERTQQQQQHLTLHLPTNFPPFTTDLPYLERILTELLHNACKYTPTGGTITVSARATPAALELRVSNTGVEIPATEYERIFDKFYRIPNHDPWKHGGTGLGLALVKQLTARLGGQIHVESGGGQTTFVLTFGPSSVAADEIHP
ncbi:GAF domain-containing protein (plasmid) [Phormidium sp. CLA17]|uniref:GAF domain-containing protein n=1 Tax=Leptolyngbya sp. Cla-17 TaxID=2803751 RepID=UPI0014908EEF|nr:GAF domain-containing protein [Leptolyngbya sp. Cla-17]MBM0744517.1 GAF domain-containing protein [Leptolyngbya sp. Cla-17]MBM0745354.1 GAF domain-containing protein [Leptolyngbya sp. Cla-17]